MDSTVGVNYAQVKKPKSIGRHINLIGIGIILRGVTELVNLYMSRCFFGKKEYVPYVRNHQKEEFCMWTIITKQAELEACCVITAIMVWVSSRTLRVC